MKCTDLTLLAPVPIMHLKSAQEDGLQKVAFGSNVYEVFHKVEQQRHNFPVAIYIYASWNHTDIESFRGLEQKKYYKHDFIPKHPYLVEYQ